MPPCAQTECDLFTGTMENRSTVPPASAILMTAASPASPPPTTMILGAAIVDPLEVSGVRFQGSGNGASVNSKLAGQDNRIPLLRSQG